MVFRSSSVVRAALVLVILVLSWYTFQLYAELFGRLTVKKSTPSEEKKTDSEVRVHVEVDDPDALIDQKKIEDVDKQWDQEQNLFRPNVWMSKKNPCSVSVECTSSEFSFKVVTGAANVIGPSVCFNGSILMRNSLNNVDRGMNIAVVNGKTGVSLRQAIFDLYGKDSTELKNFLKALSEEEVILVTTSDDAAFKLDDEAKQLFVQLGSNHSKQLGFRDNWVFVGGKNMKKPTGFEQILKNNKETNKYGDWPEAITIQGCLPKLT